MVALRSALWSQEIRPGHQPGGSHEQLHACVSEWQRRANGRIFNLILEFQIRKSYGMAEAAGVEIHAAHKVAGNVLVVIQGVSVPESSTQDVLKIREAKERT